MNEMGPWGKGVSLGGYIMSLGPEKETRVQGLSEQSHRETTDLSWEERPASVSQEGQREQSGGQREQSGGHRLQKDQKLHFPGPQRWPRFC